MAQDETDALTRIATALERLANPPENHVNWRAFPAYVWDQTGARPVENIDAPDLDLMRGIDRQKELVVENVARLARGHASHDILLWGSRGMGKSALLRAAILAAQSEHPGKIALVQVGNQALDTLPQLFARLSEGRRQFLVYLDDLGFSEDDTNGPRQLRSWLEGGVEARPNNVRIAVTSNRRAIIAREASEQDGSLNPRDALDDKLALADRFGLAIGFHACDKPTFLSIVSGYAEKYGLTFEEDDALEWAMQRGVRSGRSAWQYVTEIAGRAGRAL